MNAQPIDLGTIVWFRQDLRVSDNAALDWAIQNTLNAVFIHPIFILDEESDGMRPLGGASRLWLHHSLIALQGNLAKLGLNLMLYRGKAKDCLLAAMKEFGASAVAWNRLYEPYNISRDSDIKTELHQNPGLLVKSFTGNLLLDPWEIKNKTGEPYRVFTPFWKALQQLPIPAPSPMPKPLQAANVQSIDNACFLKELASWELLPTKPDWSDGFHPIWTAGENGAHQRLQQFLEGGKLENYAADRDRPDLEGVSRLSPHLHFGEISPRQIYQKVQNHKAEHGHEKGAEKFLSEVGWREFSYNLLYHFPTLPKTPLDAKFAQFPWEEETQSFLDSLERWQRGQTGIPIVDAGMRQLWQTGWMHNRVRMIVASFLVKNLLLHWHHGEEWFWDTLVDADLASNAASWQWVAGCGADAAPYFRIFNPVTQGERFDPNGDYIRAFVPELAKMPKYFIHKPWEAPILVRISSGLKQDRGDGMPSYPDPMVNLLETRNRALAAFEALKQSANSLNFSQKS